MKSDWIVNLQISCHLLKGTPFGKLYFIFGMDAIDYTLWTLTGLPKIAFTNQFGDFTHQNGHFAGFPAQADINLY